MGGHWNYLLVLAACLLLTLPLELVLGARVWRRPKALLLAVLPVALLFCLWDAVAVRAGLWTYDPRQTVPLRLPGLPLEEILFFLIIPVCALLTFEAVGRLPHWVRALRHRLGRGEDTDA